MNDIKLKRSFKNYSNNENKIPKQTNCFYWGLPLKRLGWNTDRSPTERCRFSSRTVQLALQSDKMDTSHLKRVVHTFYKLLWYTVVCYKKTVAPTNSSGRKSFCQNRWRPLRSWILNSKPTSSLTVYFFVIFILMISKHWARIKWNHWYTFFHFWNTSWGLHKFFHRTIRGLKSQHWTFQLGLSLQSKS